MDTIVPFGADPLGSLTGSAQLETGLVIVVALIAAALLIVRWRRGAGGGHPRNRRDPYFESGHNDDGPRRGTSGRNTPTGTGHAAHPLAPTFSSPKSDSHRWLAEPVNPVRPTDSRSGAPVQPAVGGHTSPWSHTVPAARVATRLPEIPAVPSAPTAHGDFIPPATPRTGPAPTPRAVPSAVPTATPPATPPPPQRAPQRTPAPTPVPAAVPSHLPAMPKPPPAGVAP